MARVGRLAGALLAQTEGGYWLVGDLKEPCDWAAAGFADAGPIDPLRAPYVPLAATGKVALGASVLEFDIEGEPLVRLLARRMLIARNGSVSERLWDLITEDGALRQVDARWLGRMPEQIWDIVRDSVLRCL